VRAHPECARRPRRHQGHSKPTGRPDSEEADCTAPTATNRPTAQPPSAKTPTASRDGENPARLPTTCKPTRGNIPDGKDGASVAAKLAALGIGASGNGP